MFDIGFWELLVIALVALLVIGPEQLPGAIRSTLKTLRRVKQSAGHFKHEMEAQLRIQELHENLRRAEQGEMGELPPDVQQSIAELKAAAESVNQPYKQAHDVRKQSSQSSD